MTPAHSPSTFATVLDAFSFLRVHGADARAFLNSQLTNDVDSVRPGQVQLNAWCTAKGRALTLTRVLARTDDYLLQLPAELRDDILKRLRMFVLRSKVVIEPIDLSMIGIVGANATAAVQSAVSTAPANDNEFTVADDIIVMRLTGTAPRYCLLAASSEIAVLRAELKNKTTDADPDVWWYDDITAGLPWVFRATSEMFIPQMLNLDLVDGLSFTKGCYPGQEIVARVHYRGRIKERMFRAHIDSATRPQPGDAVYAPSMGSQAAGNVVIAAASPNGGFEVLVVVQLASSQSDVRLGSLDGAKLSILSLPYVVPMESA